MRSYQMTERERDRAGIRGEQRRLLRAVPSALFHAIRWDYSAPAMPKDIDPVEVEAYLRKIAGTKLTDEAGRYLEDRIIGDAAEWSRRAINGLDGSHISLVTPAALESVSEQTPEVINKTDHPINQSVLQFMVFAMLADIAAGDAYIDPRAAALK